MTQEQEREEIRYPKYRWFLLLMGWGILCLTSYNHSMLNVRYDLLDPRPIGLALTTTQFYLCVTSPALASIAFAFISGFLTDWLGVKRVILYGSLVTALGALLRLVSTGFPDLFIYSVIMGVGLGTVAGNVPKLVGAWFPVRQIYMGIALFTTSLGIGPFLALATGAMFATWKSGFLIMGILLVAACVVWAIWARERPKDYLDQGKTIIKVPFKDSFSTVFKNKTVWLMCASYCLVAGVVTGWTGGMPLVLKATKGISGGAAGIIISLSVVGYIIGIVLWSWVAEKIGRMKPVYSICMVMSGFTGWMLYLTAPGPIMWVLGIFPGLFMGAGYPLIMQMPLRMKGIGTRYAGTAMGVIGAAGYTMSFIMLPYIFTPIWHGIGAVWAVFMFFMALTLGGALFIFGPEVGRKYMMKVLTEAVEAAKKAQAPTST